MVVPNSPTGSDGRPSLSQVAAPYLTRGVDLTALLRSLVDAIVDALGADRGTLYLVDGSQRTLTSVVAHLPELPHIQLRFGQGVAGMVAESGLPWNVGDVAREPHFDAAFDEQTGYRTRAMLVVPIHDSARGVIAVLQLLNPHKGTFSEADVERALHLSAQAGQVLESTSLYADLRAQTPLAGRRPGLAFRFNQVVGESVRMQAVYRRVEKAAGTRATVLLTGESGTGKELIARAIHVNSPRRQRAFVKVDCTTLPETLIEDALFGHEKGAFTGADRTVPGKFEVADGGTLFLDEVGELPLLLQGKLLRVLQDREFERVGGTRPLQTDIRVICATHRDLGKMVDVGTFREDLFYRLRVIAVELPPLRERGEGDVLRLIEHFVNKFSRLHERPILRVSEEALARLLAHDYPGNIRELENLIESAVVMSDGGAIDEADLAFASRRTALREHHAHAPAAGDTRAWVGDPQYTIEEIEQAHIRQVLEALGGNQSEAARRLGISRNTLARKLHQDAPTHALADDEA